MPIRIRLLSLPPATALGGGAGPGQGPPGEAEVLPHDDFDGENDGRAMLMHDRFRGWTHGRASFYLDLRNAAVRARREARLSFGHAGAAGAGLPLDGVARRRIR